MTKEMKKRISKKKDQPRRAKQDKILPNNVKKDDKSSVEEKKIDNSLDDVFGDDSYWIFDPKIQDHKELILRRETEAFKQWNPFYYTIQLKKILKTLQLRVNEHDPRHMHWTLIGHVNAGKTALANKLKEIAENTEYNGKKCFIPFVRSPEQLTWKGMQTEILFNIGIKKKQRSEVTGDLARDIEDQVSIFRRDGETKQIPLIIIDNMDKLILESDQSIADILDGLLSLSERCNVVFLLVGTSDLENALSKNPSLKSRYPSLHIETFRDQVKKIKAATKDEDKCKKRIRDITTEFGSVLYTVSRDLSKGGIDCKTGVHWSFPDQFEKEFNLARHTRWFMKECYGRMGETMQTIRIAGYNVLEDRRRAITMEDLIWGREILGKAMKETTYQYEVLRKKKGLL